MEAINTWTLNCQDRPVISGTGLFHSLGVDTTHAPDQGQPFLINDMGDGTIVLEVPGVMDRPNIYPTATNEMLTDYQVTTYTGSWITNVTPQAQFQPVQLGDDDFALYSRAYGLYVIADGNLLEVLGRQISEAARFTATGQDHESIFDLLRVTKSAQGMVFPPISLAGRDLSGTNLGQCDFRRVTSLSGCNLNNTVLEQATFAGQHLGGLQISGADCQNADFSGCDFTSFTPGTPPPGMHRANLTGAVLPGSLTGISLTNAVLANADLTGADLSGPATDLTGADFTGQGVRYFRPAYQGSPTGPFNQGGIGGFDLSDPADLIIAYDYAGTGHLDHLVCYRPGKGAVSIVKKVSDANSPDAFSAVYSPGGGIGGWDLSMPQDRIIAYDYEGSGNPNYLVCYRPGKGAVYIVKKASDANSPNAFSAVYTQGDPGGGIGGYPLTDPADQIIAYDYEGSGHLNYLVCYRPGSGVIQILKKVSDANRPDAFAPVYHQTGIGDFDLLSPADRMLAFDYEGSGHLNYLICYRPGSGLLWIQKKVSDADSRDAFTTIYKQDDSQSGGGTGGYSLDFPDAQVIAFDYEGSGHLDDLVYYRPGSRAGRVWIEQRVHGTDGPGAFSWSYWGGGIGGPGGYYDLAVPSDRVIAYAYSGGNPSDLVCYRPGTHLAWVMQHAEGQPATLTRTKLGGAKLAGADLTGVILAGTDFTGTDLTTVRFSFPLTRSTDPANPTIFARCTLPYAVIQLDWSCLDLTGATVTGMPVNSAGRANLAGLNARGLRRLRGDFIKAVLDGANFAGASLAGANFSGASLQGKASFAGATMPGAFFIGAILDQADFTGATLDGADRTEAANFSYAYLSNCVFTGAGLYAVIFTGATLIELALAGPGVNLQQADFSDAYLPNADFTGASLQGTKFNGAFMVECTLTNADLTPAAQGTLQASLAAACLQGATLTGTKLGGASLPNAAVTNTDGQITVQYYDQDGTLTDPYPMPYTGTSYPDASSLSGTTVCPNTATYQENQGNGLTVAQMMTAPQPPTQWKPRNTLADREQLAASTQSTTTARAPQ
jgi:uncharacterized protein YjbI with pentapeptide repeats